MADVLFATGDRFGRLDVETGEEIEALGVTAEDT
jgi:hypothetical protein